MSGKISIDVCTLGGIRQIYEIDVSLKIKDLIKTIVKTHEAFSDSNKFNINLVEWDQTRLIYNGKSLDQKKTLEEYTDFKYKLKDAHKMHIVPKGGDVTREPDKANMEILINKSQQSQKISSPISIKSSSISRADSDRYVSKSFPGTGSFLENQINRIDRRQKFDSLKNMSDSLSDISGYMKDLSETQEPSDKMDKILQMLVIIDTKLNRIIESGTR
jgi:hypothetical protein